MKIRFKTLLGVYALIPIILGVIAIDLFCFGGQLQKHLPRNPEALRLYTVFFVLPHVIASASSFLDKEYIQFYKSQLLRGVIVAIALGILLPQLISRPALFYVYVTYTIYHLITQQTGIAMFMIGKRNALFLFWRWVMIALSILIYVMLVNDAFRHPSSTLPMAWQAPFFYALGIGFLFLALSSAVLSSQSATRMGIYYIWANVGMVGCAAGLYFLRYPFFGILVARVIHDMTGFIFYIVHDENRNSDERRNIIYKVISFSSVPIYFLCPFLALLIGNSLLEIRHFWLPILSKPLMALAYFHYYTEGFMWKRNTLHRRYVPIVAAE